MKKYWRDIGFNLIKNNKTGGYILKGTVCFTDSVYISKDEATPEKLEELKNDMADRFFTDLINHPYFDKGRREAYQRGYSDATYGFGKAKVKKDESDTSLI